MVGHKAVRKNREPLVRRSTVKLIDRLERQPAVVKPLPSIERAERQEILRRTTVGHAV